MDTTRQKIEPNVPGEETRAILPETGEHLGHLKVLEHVAAGGIAHVYKVVHSDLEVIRAIKLLRPGFSRETRRRFETEAKISANLQHPNIVQIFGVGSWHGDIPYIEMEYVDGVSLQSCISRAARLPSVLSAGIAQIICTALAYAQSRNFTVYGEVYTGLVHRDIKPANVLISKEGEVKLADFGIALPAGISIHTQGPYTMGTYAYLSPEQLRGDRLDERCDIYAIGAVLYEMISGERTFPQQTVAELVENKMKGVYRPVNSTVEECPPALAQIIHRCLQADRENRYEGIEALKEDLDTFLRGETASTPNEIVHNYLHRPDEPLTPSRVMQRISPPAKLRKFAPLFIPAAAVLIVLLVTVISLWFRLRDHDPLGNTGPESELSVAPEPDLVTEPDENEADAPVSSRSDDARLKPPRQEKSAAKSPPPPSPDRSTGRPPSAAAKSAEGENKPDDLEAGNVAFRKGNWDEAEKRYRAALDAAETANRRKTAAIRLLETYVLSIRTKDALEFIEQTAVDDGKYHLLRGKAYLQAEMYEAAEKAFARAQSVASLHDGVLREATYLLGKTRDAMYLKNPSIENRLLALRVWENVLHNHCGGQRTTPLCQEARDRIDKLTES